MPVAYGNVVQTSFIMKKIIITLLSLVAAIFAMFSFVIIGGNMLGGSGISKSLVMGIAIIVGLAVFAGVREVIRHMW